MITGTPEFWEQFKKTNGALSTAEAIAIMNLASQAPTGLAAECGVYKGKSAAAAIVGLPNFIQFYLVEPEFKYKEWLADVYTLLSTSANGKNISVKPFAEYSTDVIPHFKDIAYCMIDSGSHQDGLPMREVRQLEDKMVEGGIIVFHDWDSQFVEVKEASDYLVGTGKYDYIPINWSEIIDYVNENNLEEGNMSWHHTELKNPCFIGAVKRKPL